MELVNVGQYTSSMDVSGICHFSLLLGGEGGLGESLRRYTLACVSLLSKNSSAGGREFWLINQPLTPNETNEGLRRPY